MTLQEQYDDATLDFSRGDFDRAIAKFKAVLAADAAYFDAQLALGMAYFRAGDCAAAIAEGHKAEALRPKEQFVHTSLSLFYLKAGDKQKAEHHGLQARIAGWRAQNTVTPSSAAGAKMAADSGLPVARPKPPPVKIIRLPGKIPEQPLEKVEG
jgi:tetratricopeptide (TPR) repeat protein